MKDYLQLLDSQKTLWVASGLLASAALRVASPDLGWWLVPAVIPATIATWGALRIVTEVIIRWRFPGWIREHIPSLILGTLPPTPPSLWSEPISKRIAVREYERIWKGSSVALRENLKLLTPGGGTSEIVDELNGMVRRWADPNPDPLERSGLVLWYSDPLHSSISLPEEFRLLVAQPLVQRLHDVRQLPFAFPAFPGGTHSRFAHSLGVAHLAMRATRQVLGADKLWTNEGLVDSRLPAEERDRLVTLAGVCGLLHDLGHPPLAHTLDRFFSARFRQGADIADKEFLPRTLELLREPIEAIPQVRLDDVLKILSQDKEGLTGWDVFLSSLLDSELDVDRLDYLIRDAHFTGQREGALNIHRILSGIRPFRRDEDVFLTFDISTLPDIEQFIYAREVMYLRCYEGREKIVSESLILRGMNALFNSHPELEDEIASLRLLTDHQLRQLVADSDSPEAKELFERAHRSDAMNYDLIAGVSFEASNLGDRLLGLHRDCHRRERTLLNKLHDFAADMASAASVDVNDILLVLPNQRLSDERKEGLDIWIMDEDGAGSGFEISRLLSEESDSTVSDLLRRRKYVPVSEVEAAEDLEVLKQSAPQRGVSLLSLLRRPRYQLRLYVHRKARQKTEEIKNAFVELGLPNGLE